MLIPASSTKRSSLARPVIVSLLCTALVAGCFDLVALAASTRSPIEALRVPELEAGFHFLYEMKLEEAHRQLRDRQKSHPEDPLGSASEAAAYLFEECYRQGVLTSEFFMDDKRLLGQIPLKPDPQLRAAFFATDKQAQELAQLQLKTSANDPKALFAMSLSLGMQAEYASLIDKDQLDSLKKIRQADTYSKKLLKIAPEAADGYIGVGTANYFIGSQPRLKQFFLGIAGIHGDKEVDPADRNRCRSWSLPAAICEDHIGAGGLAREKARSSPDSASRARRGIPRKPTFCE
jgi:hypothetical protein